MQTIYPRASRSQWFADRYPGSTITPRVIVLHTTEGNTYPDYGGGASAPHFTLKAGMGVRQHFPLNRSSRALRNLPGGVDTNTAGAVQIELVGTCGWASSDNPRAPYRATPNWARASDGMLRQVAELVGWICDQTGIPAVAAAPFGPWDRPPRKLTSKQWLAARGILGHAVVPENDHVDPGAININRIIDLITTPTGDLTMAQIDELNARLDRIERLLGAGVAVAAESQRQIADAVLTQPIKLGHTYPAPAGHTTLATKAAWEKTELDQIEAAVDALAAIPPPQTIAEQQAQQQEVQQ